MPFPVLSTTNINYKKNTVKIDYLLSEMEQQQQQTSTLLLFQDRLE
jgi:hypothetical protein